MLSGNDIDELIDQTSNYVVTVQNIIDHIKNAKKPEDRLGFAAELSFCLNGMLISIKGWGSWLNNIQTLNTLQIEDLKTVYNGIKDLSVDFLKIDLEITKKKLEETKAQIEKLQKTTTKTKEKNYVS